MQWRRVPRASTRAARAKFYLDESVGVWVADVLGRHQNVQTAEDARLVGRSDSDHFAHCWRVGRVLVTHDFDFYDYKNRKLPDTRNPGVIVLNCDSGESKKIQDILRFLPKLGDVVDPGGWRHTRSVVNPNGGVTVRRRNRDSGADVIEHFRFVRQGFFERKMLD